MMQITRGMLAAEFISTLEVNNLKMITYCLNSVLVIAGIVHLTFSRYVSSLIRIPVFNHFDFFFRDACEYNIPYGGICLTRGFMLSDELSPKLRVFRLSVGTASFDEIIVMKFFENSEGFHAINSKLFIYYKRTGVNFGLCNMNYIDHSMGSDVNIKDDFN